MLNTHNAVLDVDAEQREIISRFDSELAYAKRPARRLSGFRVLRVVFMVVALVGLGFVAGVLSAALALTH